MSTTTKREFNALITGLSIALGLSIARGLNEMIGILRWWILSRRYRSLRKIELILQAESVWHVILLACQTRSFRIYASTLFWLLLTLDTQVGLAMIGLCYSVEVAEQNALVLHPGKVVVPDMSELRVVDELQPNPGSSYALEYMANSYGQMSLSYDTSVSDKIPVEGQLRDAGDPLMFCGVSTCSYVFYEWSTGTPDDNSEDQTGHISIDTGDNEPRDVFFPLPDGANQTTYLTNTSFSCGTGCRAVSAVEVSESPTWYYNCTVLVGAVTGATIPEHEVGDSIRNLAAAGIALQGFQATSRLGNPSLQFQIYPTASSFGIPTNGFASIVGMKMARFAIGAVAVAAENNPSITIEGMVPQQGVNLVVEHWNYVKLILMMVAGLHLVLGLGAALVASRVAIPKGGPVALAQLVRPLANYMYIDNRQLAEGRSGTGRWIYRSKLVSDGRYDLYMEEEVQGH
ncbi:hypothetical protein EDB81DRAFT_901335 [Dactylonectria macrodidyma]|uniref:Uncharacterized protein n=1 Tax=Dactylonectria macrodidyma TaxID=307937 RepID=A0A9P9EH50_9HYPO|nr:hypothetical protein EDB81DRAFT_901335 [Dactylonectria macrodidyma]